MEELTVQSKRQLLNCGFSVRFMDVHQLRVLRELGERGSLTAVATALHVTPSAVSQHLKALQRSAAVPLTERRGRRLVLTPAGQALAAAGADVAAALDRARRAVADHLEDRTIPVRVAAFHSAGLTLFGPLLAWSRRNGGPPVHCGEADVAQSEFPALIADHDLVIAHRLRHSPPWPSITGLTVTHLMTEPLDVAVPAGHPLASRVSVTAADVADHPWLSVQDGFPLGGVLATIAAVAGRPLDIAHRINELSVASTVVASGNVLALLPRYLMAGALHPGVVLRPLADLAPSRDVDVLCRTETLARTAARDVLTALQAAAAEVLTAAERPT
ncbi:MAG: LysR family transcriptional regulator [Modestobacter sp.]|nr:LysR family transcriptional regulator [Modestobacter sp.]